MRRRDQSEQRLARTGTDPAQRVSPGPVDAGESAAETLRKAMLRGAQDPVPAEYRRMVDRYLRSLLRETE
jgi:hypothetical protein